MLENKVALSKPIWYVEGRSMVQIIVQNWLLLLRFHRVLPKNGGIRSNHRIWHIPPPHHHLHLAQWPFVGFRLLGQVSPSSSNIQPATLDWDFIAEHVFFWNWVASPMSKLHPGGPGFVFRVYSPRWVSFSMLIEALLLLVFFQGFPSLSLWSFFPSPATQRWQCLFTGSTYLPGHKTILENTPQHLPIS